MLPFFKHQNCTRDNCHEIQERWTNCWTGDQHWTCKYPTLKIFSLNNRKFNNLYFFILFYRFCVIFLFFFCFPKFKFALMIIIVKVRHILSSQWRKKGITRQFRMLFLNVLILYIFTDIFSLYQILLYDLRAMKPFNVKDHNYELPIKSIEFQDSQDLVLSMDSKILKLWNRNTVSCLLNNRTCTYLREVFLFIQTFHLDIFLNH